MSDKRIIQENKVGLSIMKALQGHEGHVVLNVNNYASINENAEKEAYQARVMENGELIALLESFPPPRLRNFIEFLKDLSIARCGGNRLKAAQWLGVSWPTIWRHCKKLELTHEEQE